MTANRIFYEVPKRPQPQQVVINHVIDRMELEFMGRRDPMGYAEHVKRDMARQLAEYILENSQVFEMPSFEQLRRGDRVVRMELTVNDRGSYENFIPVAREEGIRDGRKRAIESLPYGFEPGMYYE